MVGADAGRVEQLLTGSRPRQFKDGQMPDSQVDVPGTGQCLKDCGRKTALGVMVLGDDQLATGNRGCGGAWS